MIIPTLTITIGRAALELPPLVLHGTAAAGGDLGIVRYLPPSRIPRTTYAPDSGDVDGSEPVATAWQQTNLGFDWVPDTATTETAVQASYAEVVAALAQFSFPVTTEVSDAPAEVWTANRGSIAPGSTDGRTHIDLARLRPIYAVTIPVQPIPGSA